MAYGIKPKLLAPQVVDLDSFEPGIWQGMKTAFDHALATNPLYRWTGWQGIIIWMAARRRKII